MKRAIAAALLGLAAVGCGGPDPKQATPATTTTVAVTLDEDPTQPATIDWQLENTRIEVLKALERNGFKVTGVKERDPGGGRLSGMTHSWALRVDGVPAFFNVFADSQSLQDWLQTAGNMGGVVVFDAIDTWALSLESDGPVRARSAKLATRIGRELVTQEAWQVRTIGGR